MNVIRLAEQQLLPDWLIRWGIRRLLAQRIRQITHETPEARSKDAADMQKALSASPITTDVTTANDQHYEVPPEFFRSVLGTRLKYSCCLFPRGSESLDEAEEQMLELVCRRAQLFDGMHILDLGCGWGSLTLWLASHYPRAVVTALSNSSSQRQYIEKQCREAGLNNVRVFTGDIGTTEYLSSTAGRRFDRIVSVEMFEHVRNHGTLLQRLSNWLTPDGKLFVHIFCHRDTTYLFENDGPTSWMTRQFFAGGMMPADDLLLRYPDDVFLERQWRVSGLQYARTCEHWLHRLDTNRPQVELLFDHLSGNGRGDAGGKVLVQRWRMFFMACAELFRYQGGNEWYVSHYLFKNRQSATPQSHPSSVTAHGRPLTLPTSPDRSATAIE
ncbi:MAG: cyclopropane-fatty-acyl-phospholipid synthase family protein [Pirellulales bacterium]